jgi:hypothetical protein
VTTSPRALVATIARELRGRRRKVVARRWALGALSAGAVATTLFAGAGRERRASTPAGGLVLVGAGTAIVPGMRLLAPESDMLRLASADGTELTLEPRGSLTVIESGDTKRFALMRGAVVAHVKKLGSGERFIVDTADAEVEVRGTMFRVALAAEPPPCGPATTTRVSVAEGVVAVSGPGVRAVLFPGDGWPAACRSPARSTGEGGADVAGSTRRRGIVRRGLATSHDAPMAASPAPTAVRPPEPPPEPTALGDQNDLFSAALRAKRRGDAGGALALFDRFIRQYPDASLVEGAFVQRMRLLAVEDAEAAARAAAQYLARFPSGFARDEAQRIAGRTAGP